MENRLSRQHDSCRIEQQGEDESGSFRLTDMDRLDRLSILVLFLLVGAMAVVLYLAPPTEKADIARRRVLVINPGLDRKIEIAGRVLASDNPRAVSTLLADLRKDFPYDGRVFMLLGDYQLRLQKPIVAMHFYRQAVDLNPDFLDKKTRLFQGRKIKGVLAEVARILVDKPDNEVRGELLYMQRKVAGGCGFAAAGVFWGLGRDYIGALFWGACSGESAPDPDTRHSELWPIIGLAAIFTTADPLPATASRLAGSRRREFFLPG